MLNNKNVNELSPLDYIRSRVDILAESLYIYANYEQLAEDAAKKGAVMKEAPEHYEFIILRFMKENFKGKSKEEIRMLLADWPEWQDVLGN